MSGAPAETVDPEWVAFFIDGARYGDMEDIEAGLAQKVPVDSKDGSGRTGMHRGSGSACFLVTRHVCSGPLACSPPVIRCLFSTARSVAHGVRKWSHGGHCAAIGGGGGEFLPRGQKGPRGRAGV